MRKGSGGGTLRRYFRTLGARVLCEPALSLCVVSVCIVGLRPSGSLGPAMTQQLAREQGITLRGSAEIVAEFFCKSSAQARDDRAPRRWSQASGSRTPQRGRVGAQAGPSAASLQWEPGRPRSVGLASGAATWRLAGLCVLPDAPPFRVCTQRMGPAGLRFDPDSLPLPCARPKVKQPSCTF